VIFAAGDSPPLAVQAAASTLSESNDDIVNDRERFGTIAIWPMGYLQWMAASGGRMKR
jgi:hypothetical protein